MNYDSFLGEIYIEVYFFSILIADEKFKTLCTKTGLIRYYFFIIIYIFYWNRSFILVKVLFLDCSVSIQQMVRGSPPKVLFTFKYDVSMNELSFSWKFYGNILICSKNIAGQRFLDLVISRNFLEFCKNCNFQGLITFCEVIFIASTF